MVFRMRTRNAYSTRSSPLEQAPPAGASDTEHASGSGLGLWIVSQIASNAGGEVSLAEPPPGFSTCFEVLLPPEEENVE
jgi:signal transduction histidine kinase